MAQIISLFQASTPPRPKPEWTNQDLAELYRVEAALVQAGLKIDTERGESDEGHPWFVFCHAESGEVIAHFALIDGEYVVAAPALDNVLRGPSLDVIVRNFITENPVSLPKPEDRRDGNVIFHPAALLTVFVATLLLTAAPDESLAAGARHSSVQETTSATADEDETSDLAGQPDGDLDPGSSGALRLDEARDHRTNEMAVLLTVAVMASEMARFQAEAAEIAHNDHRLQEVSFTSADLKASASPLTVLDFAHSLDATEAHSPINAKPVDQPSTVNTPSASEHFWLTMSENSLTVSDTEELVPESSLAAEEEVTVVSLLFDERQELDIPTSEVLSVLSATSATAGASSTSNTAADSGNTLLRWFEEQEIGLNIVERTAISEAEKAIAIVDDGISAEASAGKDGGGVPHWSNRFVEFDEDVQIALNHFLQSDDDIMAVERSDGSLVIFDQSDVRAGTMLKQHTWIFDDSISIAIVGHADTVSEAIGLVV